MVEESQEERWARIAIERMQHLVIGTMIAQLLVRVVTPNIQTNYPIATKETFKKSNMQLRGR